MNNGFLSSRVGLTRTVAELEADMRPPEHVDWDGQLDKLRPARAVVVVKHEGVILVSTRLARAHGHKPLQRDTVDRDWVWEDTENHKALTAPPRWLFVSRDCENYARFRWAWHRGSDFNAVSYYLGNVFLVLVS